MHWELKERLAGKCLAQKAFNKMFFATPADRIKHFRAAVAAVKYCNQMITDKKCRSKKCAEWASKYADRDNEGYKKDEVVCGAANAISRYFEFKKNGQFFHEVTHENTAEKLAAKKEWAVKEAKECGCKNKWWVIFANGANFKKQ